MKLLVAQASPLVQVASLNRTGTDCYRHAAGGMGTSRDACATDTVLVFASASSALMTLATTFNHIPADAGD
jgi:hypothetical protein